GYNPVFLHGKEAAGSSKACLYLIKDKQSSRIVAPVKKRLQKTFGRETYPRLGLDRFHNNTCGMAVDQFKILQAIETKRRYVGQQGPERPPESFIPHYAQGSVRTAVVCVPETGD